MNETVVVIDESAFKQALMIYIQMEDENNTIRHLSGKKSNRGLVRGLQSMDELYAVSLKCSCRISSSDQELVTAKESPGSKLTGLSSILMSSVVHRRTLSVGCFLFHMHPTTDECPLFFIPTIFNSPVHARLSSFPACRSLFSGGFSDFSSVSCIQAVSREKIIQEITTTQQISTSENREKNSVPAL